MDSEKSIIDWASQRCRDCTFRVQDVDMNNLSMKGKSVCRKQPPAFVALVAQNQQAVGFRPVGSHYTLVVEEMPACSFWQKHEGDVRKNIIPVNNHPS